MGLNLLCECYWVDLVSLQVICEVNYVWFMCLFLDMCEVQVLCWVVLSEGEWLFGVFVLEVIEVCFYIIIFQVCQELGLFWLLVLWLEVWVYYDVWMVEVIGVEQVWWLMVIYFYLNQVMYQFDEKNQFNLFFGEWFVYCLVCGYEMELVVQC